MADVKNKVAENVEGAFYVDDQCIACRRCTEEAPDNFKMNENFSHSSVYKQPENDASSFKKNRCPGY